MNIIRSSFEDKKLRFREGTFNSPIEEKSFIEFHPGMQSIYSQISFPFLSDPRRQKHCDKKKMTPLTNDFSR